MPMRDCIRWARFYTVAAENAARIINVVYRRVPLSCGDAVRFGILGGFNVNAIRWTSCRAKEAPYALFQTIFVAMQHVNSAVARLAMYGLVRVVLRDRLAQHVLEGHAKAFDHCRERRKHFADWISHNS